MVEEPENAVQLERGRRAEEVAEWFFRLNGFFLIPGFIVHPDHEQSFPRTEADLLGVRLKHSAESLQSGGASGEISRNFRQMEDHQSILEAGRHGTVAKHLVAMVEVKAGQAAINGPWSQQKSGNMVRALRRVGFGNRQEIEIAAESMYEKLRYVGREFIVQYFSVCNYKNVELGARYPDLIQITFEDIATFLCNRFEHFPQKIPEDSSCVMWRGFGYDFMRWFERAGWGHQATRTSDGCFRAIRCYIDQGFVRA